MTLWPGRDDTTREPVVAGGAGGVGDTTAGDDAGAAGADAAGATGAGAATAGPGAATTGAGAATAGAGDAGVGAAATGAVVVLASAVAAFLARGFFVVLAVSPVASPVASSDFFFVFFGFSGGACRFRPFSSA
ncbi:MAG: hypothetical protein ACKOAI_07525 [Acidimicrobiia bacterium]